MSSNLLLPSAFISSILSLNQVHRASVCTNDIVLDEQTVLWSSLPLGTSLLSFLSLDQILTDANRPSSDEVVFILCPSFDWNREYPPWAFLKNIVWLVADEGRCCAKNTNSSWDGGLRLDSRFYTYYSTTPENTSSHILLKELYRVKQGAIIQQDVGQCNVGNDCKGPTWLTSPSMWERRTDLGGLELVDTVLEWRPFVIFSPFPRVSGIFHDLLNLLASSLNFTVKYMLPPDGEWGIVKLNGTHEWMSGMSGQLNAGEADLCTAGQYLSPERQVYTEMVAIITDYSTIVVPLALLDAGGEINMMAYIKIFSLKTWSLTLASAVAISTFYLLSKTHQVVEGDNSVVAGLSDGLQVSYLSFLQRGSNVVTDGAAVRVAFLTASMLGLVMFSYYTGDLTAQMTYRPPSGQLKNFQV